MTYGLSTNFASNVKQLQVNLLENKSDLNKVKVTLLDKEKSEKEILYSRESIFFFEREFSNLKGLERAEVLITSHANIFLGNKYNSYIHTARNTKVASTRNVYGKIAMKRKKVAFGGVFRTHE